MNRIFYKVNEFVEKKNLLSNSDKILLALSGGPDSVFLLHYLLWYKKRTDISILPVHFNHNLRGDSSTADENFVSNLCEEQKLKCLIVSLEIESNYKNAGQSLEEYARSQRYFNLEKLCEKFGMNKIATAHNLDDNTETVLLNLFHGTGLEGMSGIPPKRGKIVRPLLILEKEEILNYLNFKNHTFVIDESNNDTKFRRNFLRHEIIPLLKKNINPSLNRAIYKSSELFRSANSLIVQSNEFANFKQTIVHDDNTIYFDKDSCKNINSFIFGRCFKEIIQKVFNIEATYLDSETCFSLCFESVGKKFNLTGGLTAISDRSKIMIYRLFVERQVHLEVEINTETAVGTKTLSIKLLSDLPDDREKSKNVEYISATGLCEKFLLRNWKAGDFFKPFGMTGNKKVSDFLTDSKIPVMERKEVMVLENSGKIIWVVGYRIDDSVKIKREDSGFIELIFE